MNVTTGTVPIVTKSRENVTMGTVPVVTFFTLMLLLFAVAYIILYYIFFGGKGLLWSIFR